MRSTGTAFFDNVTDLATFIAALVREGVTFESRPSRGGWEVKLTGGY